MRLSILTSFAVLTSCGVPAEPSRHAGAIELTSMGKMSFAFATFFERTTNDCAPVADGECEVTDCAISRDTLKQRSAGPITVSGVEPQPGWRIPFGTQGCLQNCPAYVSPSEITGALWKGGEPLVVSAPGDEVPGFGGVTVVAPSPITLTAPTCGDTVGIPECPVKRSDDFTIAWTGGERTQVNAVVASATDDRIVQINCWFTRSPAVIPARLLKKLPDADDYHQHTISIQGANQTKFVTGDYTVSLGARNPGLLARATLSN